MADRLGLDVKDASKYVIESAGGEVSVGYAEVVVEVFDGGDHYRWPMIIGVTDQEWSEAILGHSGFLAYFDILFRGADREVHITRNAKSMPRDS